MSTRILFTTVSVFILVAMQLSCRTIIGSVYGVNKHHDFKNSDAYLSFINEKEGIPPSAVLYMDSAGGSKMVAYFETRKSNNGYFLGSYINDSTKAKESKDLSEDENCWGRILKDLGNNIKPDNLQTEHDTFLQHKTMYFASTEKRFSQLNDSKLKIFLLFSASFGTLYKRNYQEIVNFVNKHSNSMELFVISLDYGDDGKGNKNWN